MQIGDEDKEMLRRLEEKLWQEEWRYSQSFMEEVLAPDYFEFGASGRTYDRATTINLEPQEIRAVLPLPDFEARLLSPDVAQVTYRSIDRLLGRARQARRSSIWSRTENGWVLRFHQGTLLPAAEE
jgi:hypothetical protein